jgi:tetratricopeptide (TPR) repeat protein
VEIAMEIAASGQTPGDAALEVLRVNAALMREQIGLARNERFRNRIKAVRDGGLVATLAALAVGFGFMIYSAATDRSVVMQAWSLPKSLVDQGLTSEVVAGDVIGRISQMQRRVEDSSFVASVETLEGGEDALRLEIPSTGVSLGDLDNYLRQRLGRRTTISAALQQRGDGFLLTVRLSGGPNQTFAGGPDDLPVLMQQAAESIMRETQPLRYADFLTLNGRFDEARAVLVPLTTQGTVEDRASAFASLGRVFLGAGDTQTAETIGHHAVRMYPDSVNTQLFLAFSAYALSHSQQDFNALLGAKRALESRKDNARLSPSGRTRAQALTDYALAEDRADFLTAAEMMTRVEATYRGDAVTTGWGSRPIALARARDLPASRDAAIQQRPAGNDGRLAVSAPRVDLYQAAAIDDWAAVRDLARAKLPPVEDPRSKTDAERLFRPMFAIGLARTGDLAGAREAIALTPMDCDFCVRARGVIEALAGNDAGADAAFRLVTRRAPSLPFAFSEWGEAKLARGDEAGAITLFRQAQVNGPRWADPVKYEADALMAQGDAAGAIRKYRAAADRAPRWGALHLAWGRALEAQGRRDQAREKYSEAARMDLSAADRAEVARRLGART